jgi:hypothetical protein
MMDDISDPSHFFRDQDLIHELRKVSTPLSLKAAERIAWLRENMIDPAEYMRVSNERGELFGALMKR